MKSIFLFVSLLSFAFADQWAVIVAGSDGFWNYRHQADACHAYQLHKAHGIPEDHIILFSVNDVVNSKDNKLPGHLYNQPGSNAPDVYDGCKVTYEGKDVTRENYLSVLLGDADGITKRTGIKNPLVLKSNAKDNVFLTFFDHGSEYFIVFPDAYLKADDLLTTLVTMHKKQMYSKLVYYLESCESASMFLNLTSTLNIYAVTAASMNQPSWGFYCEVEVRGERLGTCLGDLFSITWMEDTDLNRKDETFLDQWKQIQKRVNLSQPQQFGDNNMLNLSIWDFIGNGKTGNLRAHSVEVNPRTKSISQGIQSRNIYYEYIKGKLLRSENGVEYQKYSQLVKQEETYRTVTDNRFRRLTKSLTPNTAIMNKILAGQTIDVRDRSCYYKSVTLYEKYCGKQRDYALGFYSVLLNLCEYTKGNVNLMETSIKETCSALPFNL